MGAGRYSQPLRYQYKPLGLSRFAGPLAQMQQQYDVALSSAQDSEFNLNTLSSERMKGRELISDYEKKRDKITAELQKTKNFRKTAADIKKLNREWTKNEHALALSSNYDTMQEYIKNEKKRYSEGIITKEQLDYNIARTLSDFSSKGGTNYQMGEHGISSYNTIDPYYSTKDLSKEWEDKKLELAKLTPEQIFTSFGDLGIDEATGKQIKSKYTTKLKSKDKIKAVEEILSQSAYFRPWLEESTNAKLYSKQKNNPEQYEKDADKLVKSKLAAVNNAIENHKTKKGEEYEKLLGVQEALESNSSGIRHALMQGQELDQLYNMDALANFLSYKNVISSRQYVGAASAGEKEGSGFLTGFVPGQSQPLQLKNLTEQRISSAKNLYPSIKQINNIAGGSLRTLVMGNKYNQAFRDQMSKDPAKMYARQQQILSIASNSTSAKDFHNKLWNAGIRDIASEGGKAGFRHATTTKVWNALQRPGAMQEAVGVLDNATSAYNDYMDSKSLMDQVDKAIDTDSKFLTAVNNIGSKRLTEYALQGLSTKNDQATIDMFDYNSYTPEQLKAAGVEKPNMATIIGGQHSITALNFNEVARLQGYKDAYDAYQKGFDFGGAIAHTITESTGWGSVKKGVSFDEIMKGLKQSAINRSTDANIMTHSYINDPDINKGITNIFLTAQDLTSFRPAFAANWDALPGFNEDGTRKEGTELDFSGNKTVRIVKQGNRLLYEVPYKYKGDEGPVTNSIMVEPKSGMNELNYRVLQQIDANSGNKQNTLQEQTNDMAKVMKFDMFNGNILTPTLFEATPSPSEGVTPPVLQTVEVKDVYGAPSGTVLEFVKDRSPLGEDIIKIQMKNQTGTTVPLRDDEGKIFMTRDIEAAKVKASELLGY